MTLPVLRGFGCWGLMRGVWHHQDRRRRGPVSSLASWTTRGEDHPTARLLDLVPGRSGTVYKNWLAERGEQFRSGIQIATVDPFQGQQERLCEAFTADEAHISVDVAYLHRASARGLPPRHTRPRPTPGRSFHRAPTSLSHPRNRSPGPDPTQVEGRLLGLLRYRRSQQRLHGSHQRTLSSWADESPEATATPPATNSECSSSQEA